MLAVKPEWTFYDRGISETLPRGLCFISSPHTPGTPHECHLDTLSHALRTASDSRLVPVMLGNLFQSPHAATPALFSSLFRAFRRSLYRPIANLGSQDKRGALLTPDCALWVLAESGAVSVTHDARTQTLLIDLEDGPMALYAVPNGQNVPEAVESLCPPERTVVITHEDLDFGEMRPGARALHEVRGASLLVNGYLRDTLGPQVHGGTVCVSLGGTLHQAGGPLVHEPAVWTWRPGQRMPERHRLRHLPAAPAFALTAVSEEELEIGMAEDGAQDAIYESPVMDFPEQDALPESDGPSP
jgi:hypothetical protein